MFRWISRAIRRTGALDCRVGELELRLRQLEYKYVSHTHRPEVGDVLRTDMQLLVEHLGLRFEGPTMVPRVIVQVGPVAATEAE